MKKLIGLLVGIYLVTACSQLTTGKEEKAALKSAADSKGDVYVECIREKALAYSGNAASDITMIVQLSATACQTELDTYKEAQLKLLESEYMMTDKPLAESVAALDKRAATEVGAELLSRPAAQPAAAGAAVAAAPAAVAATRPAAAAPPAGGWSAAQRIYLDCMEDQGARYAMLNESAAVIADVAQSRCRSYMGSGGAAAALEQEGRAVVMGSVMDARLEQSAKQP